MPLRATASFNVQAARPTPSHSMPVKSDDDLRWWSDRGPVSGTGGRDVFVYFNNDGEGNAVMR